MPIDFTFKNFRYVILHLASKSAFFVANWYRYQKYYENITNASWERLIELSCKSDNDLFETKYEKENGNIVIYSYNFKDKTS